MLISAPRLLYLMALLHFCGAARAAEPDFGPAKDRFAKTAAEVLARDIAPGFSVAWIVDGKVVHAAGYGLADWEKKLPATPETIYRAGSISKLFNAVAAMQLVEQGKLDLDAPIRDALPEFSIVVPFAKAEPITIRQLLCHRSGMIREAPVGGYLDPNQPTIEATLKSVADCVLVNPPDSKTRYSNVGPTIVGAAVARQGGMPFADYQQKHLLGPLGMTSSAWLMNDTLRPKLAKGRMRVAKGDGSYGFEPAKEFELGTIPAGNLYTTASDLARFAAFLMSGGSSELAPPLLKPESLIAMTTPQLTKDTTGFGLGFAAGTYRDHKTVQHSGAVYGFTTILVVMPAEKIGIVVLSNADIAMSPVRQLADASLDLLLETVKGEKPPDAAQFIELSSDELARLTGQFESTSYWCDLRVENNQLVGELSGQPITLRPASKDRFLADGRIMFHAPFEIERDQDGSVKAFAAAGQRFERVAKETPATAPAWQGLCGSYGPRFIPLVVSIRHGHLYATVENEYDYRLTPVDRFTFKLPPGMYSDEQVVFQTSPEGVVLGAVMANMYLPKTR